MIVAKQVNIVTSVDNFLAVLVSVAKDAKAGKTPAQVAADALPALVQALAGIGDLSKDFADRKDLEVTVALKLAELTDILVG